MKDLPPSVSEQLASRCRFYLFSAGTLGAPLRSLQNPGNCLQSGETRCRANQQGSIFWDADRHRLGEGLSNGLLDCQILGNGRQLSLSLVFPCEDMAADL